MKYFLDTEFIEKPNTIQLISIGIVSEDGREFYAESSDFDENIANNWVKENVISNLWSRQSNKKEFYQWFLDGGIGGLISTKYIGSEIKRWIGNDTPEFWGYYADYDWVVTCWLFGSMIDLPKGWPMYCRDIKQLCDMLGNPKLPKQDSLEHNALYDARWNKLAYKFLQEYKNES
jgi:hypothetical protein